MNQTEQLPQRYDDEVSLVELATIFVRRRRVFYATFGGVVVLSVLYAFFLVGEVREYTTLIQLGERYQEKGMEPIQPTASVIATIENRWYPEIQAAYIEEKGDRLPFSISASNPPGTPLIKLLSQASPSFAEEIKKVHQKLVEKISKRQTELFERQKDALEQRLESVSDYLDSLSGNEAVGEAAAQAVRSRVELAEKLQSLKDSETLVVARQSLDRKGPSRNLIIALAIMFGLILGIVAAFVAEFIDNVRTAIINDTND